ncbi:MAG: SpoIIE family protein phosphatase [Bacteroidales bacterium]|nr:SpoIIE family protein phosphatase [Bacteroidales bacterium]
MLLLASGWGKATAQEFERTYILDSLRSVLDTMPENKEKLITLSEYAYYQMQVDSMRKYSWEGIRMSKRLKNGMYEANGYRFLGWSYTVTGESDSAFKYYYRAANVFDSIDATRGLGYTYIGISELDETLNHLSEAVEYIMTVIKMGEDSDDENLLSLGYYRMGVLYNKMGAENEAMEYLNRAINLNAQINNTMQQANNLREKASTILKHAKETSEMWTAKELLKKANSLYHQTEDFFDAINTYHMLCESYIMLARQDSTLRDNYLDSTMIYYSEGKDICQKSGQHFLEILMEISLIKYMIETGNVKRASHILDSLKQMDLKEKEMYEDIQHIELEVLKAQGKWKECFYLFEMLSQKKRQKILGENDVKMTKMNSSRQYLNKLKKREKDRIEAQKQNEFEQKIHKIINNIILAILIIAILAIMVGIVQYISKRRTNEKLQRQKWAIIEQNEKLNKQNEEIKNQRNQIEEQTQKIKDQTDILLKANMKTLDNLEAAERIQTALMPNMEKMKRMLGDVLIYWKPFNIVSGDFYWASEVMGYKFVAVADCTGHGVPGALMSTLGLSALNEIASSMQKSMKLLTAAETLNILRRKIETAISHEASRYEDSVNDGMDIALSIISPDEKILQFAGAKRPLWLARNGEITIYKGDTITVGPNTMGENKPEFTNNEIKLQLNDCIYMFSDGITDQLGPFVNGIRKKFQSGRLKKILESIHKDTIDGQWFTIDTKLQEWAGPKMEQTDDILLMGIKIKGLSQWMLG